MVNQRRINARRRLEEQLKKGMKPAEGKLVPLEDKDIARIRKEIETLTLKIK